MESRATQKGPEAADTKRGNRLPAGSGPRARSLKFLVTAVTAVLCICAPCQAAYAQDPTDEEVRLKVIELAGGRFVASGMVFEWQGGEYKICLLTYDRAILEDNILLECKNSIIIILSLVLVLLIVLSMAMSRKISRQGMETD